MQPTANNAEDTCLIHHPIEIENAAISNILTPVTAADHVGEVQVAGPESSGPCESSEQPTNSVSQGGVLEKTQLNIDDSNITHREEIEEKSDDFPEGGFRAWSVVFGSFCGSFAVFGIINSTAVLLEYMMEHQLQGSSPSQIGWIFGVSLFLTFFCGAPIGPIFDSYGPRVLIFCGSILLVASPLLLGLCSQYWHFFLVYGVIGGIGGCLVNTPCIASIGHFFLVKRGNATGIAMTAGSTGGVIFPLMLQRLLPMVGFAWSLRIVGFILAFMLAMANLLVRSRLPRKPMASFKTIIPDFSVFKDPPFTFLTLGIFLLEWGIFVPLTFITSFAVDHGHSSAFGFQLLAMLNGGSFFGRYFAGAVSDMMGRLNTLIISILLCVLTNLALWLPSGQSSAMLIVFAVIFGFTSGSNLSLSPVCVGQMCKTENYGRYFSTCWMFVAFGTLTALPIAGQILTASGNNYNNVIIFAAISYVLAAACLITARVLAVGWKITTIY